MSEDNEDDSSFELALDLPVTVRSKLAIVKTEQIGRTSSSGSLSLALR